MDMISDRSCRNRITVRTIAAALLLMAGSSAYATQPQAWFVDGYHGGIYGHYPVEWKTRFIADQLDAHPEWRIGLEIEPETWDTVPGILDIHRAFLACRYACFPTKFQSLAPGSTNARVTPF